MTDLTLFDQPKSQCDQLLDYLKSGGRITTLEALKRFNVMAASQRMTDLRKKGHDIRTRMIETESGKRVAEWYLAEESWIGR